MRRIILVLGLSLALEVFATVPIIKVANITTTKDCGKVSSVVETAPDPTIQCLRVYFDNFAIQSSTFGGTQKNCHLEATLIIPPHTQFRATEAIAEGAYLMSMGTFGGITLTYTSPTSRVSGQNALSFLPNNQGDFNLKASVPDAPMTPCSDAEKIIKLSTDIHAYIDQRDKGSSLVSFDESGIKGFSGRAPAGGSDVKKRLSWNWQIAPCAQQPGTTEPSLDLFAKPFTSQYRAPNGRYYQARIVFSGSSGIYVSNAGFEGQFYNIRRLENGRVAAGEWTAQGSTGTFSFRITDTRTGNFTGSWQDNQGRHGNWNGQYEGPR